MNDLSNINFDTNLVAYLDTNDEINTIAQFNWNEPYNIGIIIMHTNYLIVAFAGDERGNDTIFSSPTAKYPKDKKYLSEKFAPTDPTNQNLIKHNSLSWGTLSLTIQGKSAQKNRTKTNKMY